MNKFEKFSGKPQLDKNMLTKIKGGTGKSRPLTGMYSRSRPLTGIYNGASHTRPLTGIN